MRAHRSSPSRSARAGREPERGRAEAQLQHLLDGDAGVDVQVPAGDAESRSPEAT
jgi:hypothetical protein